MQLANTKYLVQVIGLSLIYVRYYEVQTLNIRIFLCSYLLLLTKKTIYPFNPVLNVFKVFSSMAS